MCANIPRKIGFCLFVCFGSRDLTSGLELARRTLFATELNPQHTRKILEVMNYLKKCPHVHRKVGFDDMYLARIQLLPFLKHVPVQWQRNLAWCL